MAGLVTEALARDEEVTWKKSLATERAAMLEALEKLKPNLAALVDKPAAKDSAPLSSAAAEAATTSASASTFLCRKCGHTLVGEEQFCGNCGTPRSSDYEPPSMQSKVASLWHMQEAMKKNSPGEPAAGPAHHESESRESESRVSTGQVPSESSLADSLERQMPELFTATHRTGYKKTESAELLDESWDQTPDLKTDQVSDQKTDRARGRTQVTNQDPKTISAEFEDSVLSDLEVPVKGGADEAGDIKTAASTALTKTDRATAWSSAATAREFLEQLATSEGKGALARFWNARRGDIYLAIAVLLVGVVIWWGIFSNHSVGATGGSNAAAAHHKAPDADLSLFDRMLISLGLAEAPPAPEYKGNPDTQVWVDLHTALYYCPGADLYGKTPKGKMTSQRDAQLDQFEPAYRKTCD
jgi:hypothetical protein